MKINLESPFKELWSHGYTVTGKLGRKYIILYKDSRSRSSISNARYVLSCSLGKIIPREMHVDHINNDPTDDALVNLQLLSQADNNRKTHKTGITIDTYTCPVCNKEFKLTAKFRSKKVKTCSRRCGGIRGQQSKQYNGLS
jgi:hypothetical protein